MYAKLAINNAKRSIRDYLIYFVTLTICVSLFYGFSSISSSKYTLITEDMFNFDMLKIMLKYSTYGVTALLVLLVGYVNKYMMKRRQKEFATYILLGTEQKSVALMFFVETLIIGIISIVAGIIIGTLFSQVVTALILMTAGQEIVFSFKIYTDTIIITFVFFISIFCIIGFFNIGYLNKIKLINMLNSEKKTEFQFKRSKFIYVTVFLIAIAAYTTCGIYAYKVLYSSGKDAIPIQEKNMFVVIGFVAFIVGTYALFYSAAYIAIVIKNKWTGFKYEYTNLFLIGSIVSKIKTVPILMATISITLLGSALCFTITLLMSQWSLGYLEYRIPFDVNISNEYISITDIDDIININYDEIIEYMDTNNYPLESYCEVERYFIQEEDFYIKNKMNMPILAIGLSDFNTLRKILYYEEVILKENEFTMQWQKMTDENEIKEYINNNQAINVNGEELNVSSNPYYTESLGEGIYNFWTDTIIVLPDKICENLKVAGSNFYGNSKDTMSYEESFELAEFLPGFLREKHIDVYNKYEEKVEENYRFIDPIHTNVKVSETSGILNASLFMRILGIYLGVVLLMISLTVLALQQLSDSIEHKQRFKTLKKLGVENKEINKIILKQIGCYFVIPIGIAIVGLLISLYNFDVIYKDEVNSYIGNDAFILNIIIGIVLIIIIYVCYFMATYYTFKRNIE